MKTKVYISLLALVLLLSTSVQAVAVVKGEIPKVEPLQSLPLTTKPNYNHNVQSGQFETNPSEDVSQVAIEDKIPVPAPIIKSSNNNLILYSVAVLLLLTGAGYFLWGKIKQKQ